MIFCFVFLRPKTDLSLYTVFGCVVSFWGQHVLYVRFEHVHHAIPRGEKKKTNERKICYCFKCLRRSSVQFHRDAKEHFYDRAFERMIRFFFYSSSLSQNINTTDIRHPIERKWLVMHTHKEQLVFFLKNKHLNSWTCCFVFEIEFRKKMHSLARSFAYFK